MDLLDHLVMMVNMEIEDPLDLRVKRENLESKEALVQEVHLELKVQREILVHLDSQATLVNRDLVELKVNLEILVIMEEKGTVEFREIQDLLANQDCKDHLENQ